MYWIYLILFVLAVFTPDLIRRDFSFLDEERAEELFIFILGATTFLIFLWKEKQLNLQLREKTKIQREASIASRDLTDTYSYIGEINRKMDILKDVALGITEGTALTSEKETEIYQSIIHAIQMFSKSSHISLQFINAQNGKIIREIKSSKKAKCNTINEKMAKEKRNFLETDMAFFIRSPKSANDIVACIAIEKRTERQRLEDPELIKALASQALFLFTFSRKTK